MIDYLLHFWAPPPIDLTLACPLPADGQVADATGFYANDSVRAAFDAIWVGTGLAVLLAMLLCYLATSQSTGRGFARRWVLFVAAVAVVGFIIPLGVLTYFPTHALAQSCETNPEPFEIALPTWVVVARGVAGAVWAPVAFVVLSLLATRVAGRSHRSGGFFHNRGIPYPWYSPFGR